ncbi:hypothetical protein, partial [Mesopusillimonas faecipullorum]|uniref:hypothetical protein n=1 Tax=Mesopusillimonas faecipullorum TaxID=2755040 RepID=UPI001D002118
RGAVLSGNVQVATPRQSVGWGSFLNPATNAENTGRLLSRFDKPQKRVHNFVSLLMTKATRSVNDDRQ